MRNIYISLVFFLVFNLGFAQTDYPEEGFRRCATMDVYERMKQEDPGTEHRMIQHEKALRQWIENNREYLDNTKEVITIPVVVHVVYRVFGENISDAQIFSQIDVLNEDFRRLNADAANTPAAFQGVAADVRIQFCLAQRTPTGQWTNGIQRRQTTVSTFFVDNDHVKYYNTGGLNAWDRSRYFNIWVCNLEQGTLGYAQFPGQASSTDGIVVNFLNFGRVGLLGAPYDKGRTATHETGHWLSLYHIWGDDEGKCMHHQNGGTDYIADTPDQGDASHGCYNFPRTDACSPNFPGIMFMNYMDYSVDACMNLFTKGQRDRMLAVMNTSRASLKSSNACTILGLDSRGEIESVMVFPNPAASHLEIRANFINIVKSRVVIYDISGRVIEVYDMGSNNSINTTLDLNGILPGIYIVEIQTENTRVNRRVAIKK